MLLAKTRANLLQNAKLALFRAGRLQHALDEAEQRVLEKHMGFRGQWDEHRRFQLEFAKSAGMRPTHSLLEFGCGPLTLGLPAIDYLDANRYTGVDVRPEVLDLAWGQIGKSRLGAKNPRLVCSKSFGADELGDQRFDFIWSFSVLFHLSDDLLDACMAQIARRLAPGGAYFANINAQQAESTWIQFPFVKRGVSFYREAAARHGLVLTELGTLQSLGFRLDGVEKVNILLKFVRS